MKYRLIGNQLILSKIQDREISVYDLQGKKIYSKIRSNESEKVLLHSKGVYLLKIDGFSRKIIIQ